MKNYRVGYAIGGVVREIRKGAKRLGEAAKKAKAKKDTESVRDVRAKGGRAGHALGHTAGRLLTKTLERVGGGPEGKPHSTKAGRIAAGVRKIKRGTKSWNKKLNKKDTESVRDVRAEGGRIGRAAGGWTKVIPRTLKKLDFPGDRTGKPHSSREGRRDSWVRGVRRAVESAKKIKKKEGGRTGLKKGGPKPGTHDYFLLHKREKKAFGGPSHSVRRAVKKILKKAKAKKDTESVKDVR